MNKPLVSVCCITYNQEKYLEKCLESIHNQNVSFNYELVISNDCSKDNTNVIIEKFKKKYPHIVKDVSPSKNLGMKNNFYYALSCCSGDYIAYCEGDDYWTDEYKLEKQVHYLQQHPDIGMVFTKVDKFDEERSKILGSFGHSLENVNDLLLGGNCIPTLSVLFKKEIFLNYISDVNPQKYDWLMCDYPFWLWINYSSKIAYMNFSSGIYRILPESACHTDNIEKKMAFNESYYNIRKFYSEKFNISIEARDSIRELFNLYCKLLQKKCWDKDLRNNIRNLYKKLTKKRLHDIAYLVFTYIPVLLSCCKNLKK